MQGGGMGIGMLIVYIAVYIFYSYCTYTLASKFGEENCWLAFVPVLNIWLMLKMAGRGIGSLILLFIPLVNIVVSIMIINDISKRAGRGIGTTLGLIFLSFIFWPLLAFTYEGSAPTSSEPAKQKEADPIN